MDKETIDKLHELEKKQCRWKRFVEVLEETHKLGACKYYCTQEIHDMSTFMGGDYIPFIIDYDDDKEFIEHVLTCAKVRLLQINKEIEQL